MMTPHELGLFFGGASGTLIGFAIPIATLRAWFARAPEERSAISCATWPEHETTQVFRHAPAHAPDRGRRPYVVPELEKSPGRPAPVLLVPSMIPKKHALPPTSAPVAHPVVAPDLGADARARAREVRDAVAGLGWPIPRATWATEAALAKLGGGCPAIEDWVPSALRELAPPAKGVPSLGPVNRRGR